MKTTRIHAFAALLALVLLLAQPLVAAAEFRVEPALTLSEEYNDNIFLTPTNPKHDYITRAVPQIHMVYSAPAWDWDFSYGYDYRYYLYGSKDHDSTQMIALQNHTSFIPETLFLDVRDDYRRVSLDTVRDYTQQSLFLNQTDTNEFFVSPYTRFNLTTQTSGTAGYQYRNVWYKETSGINKSENWAYADFKDELSARTAVTFGAKYMREQSDVLTYDRVDVYAGPRYEYADGCFIWATIGNSWFSYVHQGETSQLMWDAGVTHKFVTWTLTANTALTYVDDPSRVQRREDRYLLSARRETERLTLGATVGWWEYRDVLTKHLENTRYSLSGTVGYGFTPALRATYTGSIDRYDDDTTSTFSMLYLNVLRFDYLFPADTVLSLEYRFEHSYSPDSINFALNYDNNRVVLEIRKVF